MRSFDFAQDDNCDNYSEKYSAFIILNLTFEINQKNQPKMLCFRLLFFV